MTAAALLARLWLGTRRGERGAASVEFVIVFPIFMVVFLSCFESGMLTLRQMMLERGVDQVGREMRLTINSEWTPQVVRNRVCRAARILGDCRERLVVEMTEVERDVWTMPPAGSTCVETDMTASTPNQWDAASANDFMLLRVCYELDLFLPGTGFGAVLVSGVNASSEDSVSLIASTAFIAESDT